jgi:hypothetical protein
MAEIIQEVGVRLKMIGRTEFAALTRDLKRDIRDVGQTSIETDARVEAAEREQARARAARAEALRVAAAQRHEASAADIRLAEARATGNSVAADEAAREARELRLSARASEAQAAAQQASLRAATATRTELLGATEASAASTGRLAGAATGLAKVGKLALFGVAVTAAAVGYESVKAAGNFEQKMTQVHTLAGVASNRIADLSQGLLNMRGVIDGPVALADALYRIASANAGLGATNQQLIDMTKAAEQLRIIGGPGTNLEETARVLGGVRASDIKGAGGYKGIVGLAAATVGSGDMRMSDFINALGTGVLPAAANAGVGLPDVGALLSLLTDNLIPGSTAGHVMAHMFTLLGAPSGVGGKAFEAIGIHPTDLGYEMRSKGLIPTIGTLKERLAAPQNGAAAGGATAERSLLGKFGFTKGQVTQIMTQGADKTEQAVILAKAFGGAKQSVPIVTAIQEYDRLKARSAQIQKQANPTSTADVLKGSLGTFNNQVKSLEAAFQRLEIRIGNYLIPILLSLGHHVMDVVRFFQRHKTMAEALAITFGTVLTIAIGAFTVALIAMGVAFIGATLPISAIVLGIGLLAAGLVIAYQKSDIAKRVMQIAFGAIGLAVVTLGQLLYDSLLLPLKLTFEAMGHVPGFGWAKKAAAGIGEVGKALQNAHDNLTSLIKKAVNPVDIYVDVKIRTQKLTTAADFAGPSAKQILGAGGSSSPSGTKDPLAALYNALPGGKARSHKATGGPVQMGQSYWVGENGPEQFTPARNGTITPSRLGSYEPTVGNSPTTGGGMRHITLEAGAVVIHESNDPAKTYQQVRTALADAVARR